MDANAPAVFTINDFPPEIIMKFMPDRRQETISKLRLVSQRFYEVFTADCYYQYYLLYPDKPNLYQHDLEAIGEKKGKWKRVLELEKRRLANWRNGQFTSVETVSLPSDLNPAEAPEWGMIPGPPPSMKQFLWQGKTDESNEHWMLCECDNWQIILLNLTNKPIMSVHDVSAFTTIQKGFATLLPGQVIIRGFDEMHMFNVTKVGDKLPLEHLFTIEKKYLSELFISGKSNVTDTHKNLYITYKDSSSDGILNMWDLKGAVRLKSVALIELISHKWAVDFNNVRLGIKVYKAEFPNVLVMLSFFMEDRRNRAIAIALVNVEERKLVHWFGQVYNLDLQYCTFKGHTVCVKFNNPQRTGQSIIVYDLRKRPTLEAEQSAILFKYESENELYVFYENTTMIILDTEDEEFRYKILCNKIRIASFDGPNILQRKIRVNFELENDAINYQLDFFICIIEPFLVIKQGDKGGSILTTFDMSGNALFNWAQALSERGIVGKTEVLRIVKNVDFQSLSKCIIQNKKGDSLQICKF